MAVVSDIEIRLRADIARLQQDMGAARRSVDGAMNNITQAAQRARNALVGLGAGLGFGELVRMTDNYTKYIAQLKLATESTREFATANADVKRIASSSQQDLQSVGVLYARIANGTRELGTTQREVAQITEAVSASLVISGATATEAASAQLQLSQAFGAGALRGEEFNAVNEAAPRLMKALADGIGVPVGALRKMAEEGLITSDVMAKVLPKSLEILRTEAAQVSTIAGGFTVLKNAVTEFVGVNATASGSVAAISTLLTALANNLHLVAGALLTVVAVKIANFLDAAIARTVAAVAANNALIASNLATAKAELQAAVAADALAGARLNEIRTATLASAGNVQLALTTNGLIPAQANATRTTAALSAAFFGYGAAASAAAVGTRALNAALAFTGGPIGLIVTVLGAAATAWGIYEYAQQKANDKAAAETEASANEITASLEKQNAKLRERIKLQQEAGASPALSMNSAGADKLAETLTEINALKAKGATLDAADQIRLISLQGIYNGLNSALLRNLELKRQEEANGQAAKALVSVRERLTGINGQYLKELGLLQTALAKGAISQAEYTDLVSRLAKETYDASDAGKAGADAAKKSATAAKEAADAAKQQADAYRDLIRTLGDRAASTAREAAGLAALTTAEQAHIDLDRELADGKLRLNKAQEVTARDLINEARANEVLAKSNKEWLALQETMADAAKSLAAERMALVDSARREAEQNEFLVETFGMTEDAIIRLNAARLIEQETQRLGRSLTEDEIADLQRVIALKERSAKAVADRRELEATKQFWTDIEKTARATFVSIADGGKNAFQRLKDTAKNVFFDWLYQQTLKKWIINIGTASAGTAGVSGIANAAVGGAGQAFSLANSASSLYGALTGGATLAGGLGTGFLGSLAGGLNGAGIGSGLTSALGMNIGNGIASVVGPNIASGIASGLSGLAAAAPWVAGALAVVSIGKAAFGRGPKEYSGNSTINGSFGAEGFAGTVDADWIKKGGWLRSDKKGVDSKPLEEALSAGLAQAYEAIKTSSSQYAGALGIDAKNIADRAQKVKIALGKDGVANEKAITDFLGTVADSVAKELLPAVGQFSKLGESASQTFERIAVSYKVVEEAVVSMGGSFGAVGVDSISARERLLELAGGIEKFATDTSGFQQNFLSEAERNAPVLAHVTDKLKELGLAGVGTRDQFRDAVMGLAKNGALATAEGAKQYAELIGLQADVARVFPDAAAARSLEIELMRLQGRESEALAAERKYELSAMDAALRPFQERIYVLRDEAAAVETANALLDIQSQIYELNGDKAGAASVLTRQHAAALALLDPALRGATQQLWSLEAAAKAIEKAKTNSTKLVEGVERAFSVLQSVSQSQKKILEADVKAREKSVENLRKISDSSRAAFDALRTPEDLRKDQRLAVAEIMSAVTIARAGGPLPDEKNLQRAIKDLGAGLEQDNYASYIDYQRELAQTRNALGELANLSDGALTIEEQSLRAVEDQIKLIDLTLEKAQEQVDVLKGISVIGISIEQAVRALDLSLAVANNDPLTAAKSAINTAYKDALGRAPDAAGAEWWSDKVAGGVAIRDVVGAITNSTEAQLRAMYKSVLGREADSAGMAFWSKAFGATIDASEYAQFIKGAEYELGLKAPPVAYTAPTSGTMTVNQSNDEMAKRMDAKMSRMVEANEKLAEQFERVSNGGNALLVET